MDKYTFTFRKAGNNELLEEIERKALFIESSWYRLLVSEVIDFCRSENDGIVCTIYRNGKVLFNIVGRLVFASSAAHDCIYVMVHKYGSPSYDSDLVRIARRNK